MNMLILTLSLLFSTLSFSSEGEHFLGEYTCRDNSEIVFKIIEYKEPTFGRPYILLEAPIVSRDSIDFSQSEVYKLKLDTGESAFYMNNTTTLSGPARTERSAGVAFTEQEEKIWHINAALSKVGKGYAGTLNQIICHVSKLR
jgi:hypothetical protein